MLLVIRFLKNLYKNLRNYIPNISIHGLSNIFKSSKILEICFWIVIFLFGVQYFYGMLYNNLIGFTNQPVTKSITTTAFPISFVPFPAVTICNFNVVYKSYTTKVKKLLLDKGIEQELAEKFFKELILLRTPLPVDVTIYNEIYEILDGNGYSNQTKLMQDLSQPCHKMLKSCLWAGTEVKCNEIFQPSIGDFGFCCSFNSDLDPLPTGDKEYYTSAGPLQGLIVKLNIDTHEYVAPLFDATGAVIIVHNKNAYASSDYMFYTVAQPGTEASMKIIPSIFEAEPELDEIPVDFRNCWLDSEGTKFLDLNYSFYNCMHMCKSDTIVHACNCIPHFHRDYSHLRPCNLLDMPCLSKNYENFTALHVTLNQNDEHNKGQIICDCLPPCTETSYDGTTEALYFKNKEGELQTDMSGLRVYFQNNFCTKYSLSRSVTTETFIALTGGLFSFCLGGSILSVSELIYYLIKSLFENAEKRNEQPSLYWAEFKVFEKMQKHKTNVLLSKRNTNYK